MQKFKGSLTYEDYKSLINSKLILGLNKITLQIQPSSIDLTLSNECYEINSSFLSSLSSVRDKLKKIKSKEINLNKKFIFKKNKTYLVRLNERLNLSRNIFGLCNPKSSTGRLDIFCRTILNFSDGYEKIPKNYKGEMFLEITSRSFDIEFKSGDSLNQMRLFFNKHVFVSDTNLRLFHKKYFLTMNEDNEKIKPNIDKGLRLGVDLSRKNKINGYFAKNDAPLLCYNKIKYHKINDFWNEIKCEDEKIIIKKGEFYILKSKEKIQIPKNIAGEMVPYDTGLGDFRAHYAGFFDPGFGYKFGSYAVLEVKTNEVPFLLEDAQIIASIKFEYLNKNSNKLYGKEIKSNYQHQTLALSKHFV